MPRPSRGSLSSALRGGNPPSASLRRAAGAIPAPAPRPREQGRTPGRAALPRLRLACRSTSRAEVLEPAACFRCWRADRGGRDTLLFSFLLRAGIQKIKLVKFLLLRAKGKTCEGERLAEKIPHVPGTRGTGRRAGAGWREAGETSRRRRCLRASLPLGSDSRSTEPFAPPVDSPSARVSRGIAPSSPSSCDPENLSLRDLPPYSQADLEAEPSRPPRSFCSSQTAPFSAVPSIFHTKCTPSLEFLLALSTRLFFYFKATSVSAEDRRTLVLSRRSQRSSQPSCAWWTPILPPSSSCVGGDGPERPGHAARWSHLAWRGQQRGAGQWQVAPGMRNG